VFGVGRGARPNEACASGVKRELIIVGTPSQRAEQIALIRVA
jgi:hypothetical protein